MTSTLTWPDGTIYTITHSGPEQLEMEWQLPAHGWAPQPLVHPHLTEEYEVLEGSLELRIGRTWRTLHAGERAAVQPGTVHTFRAGKAPARVRNFHRHPEHSRAAGRLLDRATAPLAALARRIGLKTA